MNCDVVMPVLLRDQGGISLTESAVESIRKNKVRLIIVDDGSLLAKGLLKELADVYIDHETNKGYAQAVNTGLEVVKTPLVCISNNDIRVSPNWLEVAEEVFADPTVGSLHFRMIPYDQPFNPGDKLWKTGKERWSHCSFFVCRNVQKYDPNFFNTFDDWDFMYRLRKEGYKTAYTNKVEFQHMDTYTISQLPVMTERNKQNYEYFKKKHGFYPDKQFELDYAEQFKVPWRPFP